MRNLRDLFQARIRHCQNADVRVDGAEGIIFRRRLVRARNGVKKRRFADVWKTNNSCAEHDFLCGGGLLPPKTATLKERRYSCKSGRRDLNPRPLEPHSSALPSCATARFGANYSPIANKSPETGNENGNPNKCVCLCDVKLNSP